MPITPSGADTLAVTLLANLTVGTSFEIPTPDLDDSVFDQPDPSGELYGTVTRLTNADLTAGVVGGSGTFDVLMASVAAHLRKEYEENRITGQEYTKAYIGLVQVAMQSAVQFLLSKDSAYLQALLVQRQARTAEVELTKARVDLEVAKASLAATQYTALTAKANYALTEMKLATEDVTYAGVALDNAGKTYTQANIFPKQLQLLSEQTEAQRAQTLDTRSDGPAVTGVLGKQKALYDQQITSYKRDAETKAAKMWVDAWITQKTLDEGLLPPPQFQNTQLDTLLGALRTNLSV
jgi:hypothetical protein